MRLQISKLGPESAPLLRNLFEHYVHDMSEWFKIDTKPDGSFSFDTSKYWNERYQVYLAKTDAAICGFAIVGSSDDWSTQPGGHDVGEFFVLRKFRRSGVGLQFAEYVWHEHPGEWLVRVLEGNRQAALFWRTAITRYTRGAFEEEQRIVKDRAWRFFRFRCVVRSAL